VAVVPGVVTAGVVGAEGCSTMEREAREGKEGREEPTPEILRLSAIVVDAGLKVHRTLGPGLLESVYERCLARELELRGVASRRQVQLPVIYEGLVLETGFRIDLLVAEEIIVEVKAVEALTPLHAAQTLTYLRLSQKRMAFLMNFNVVLFKQGLKRLVQSPSRPSLPS
jgi:GxxExxY protein